MPTRADIPREDVTRRCPSGSVSKPDEDRHSDVASRTKRSLLVAVLTLLCLGAYYRGARVSLLDSAGRRDDVQMLRAARSSALFALNEMKQALSESWTDRRIVGTCQHGSYWAVAVLRRNRGTVRATGITVRSGGEEASYRVRTVVLRQPRAVADASSGYDVIMEAPTGETEYNAISPFIESSNKGD